MDEEMYCLTILTALVRQIPPRSDEALKRIHDIKEREEKGESVGVSADAALDYLIFLVEVKDLYNVALSMYDFPLVLMVAGKSQMDPKEYIPFLARLRSLPPLLCRAEVDLHLR